jgi:predicted nucleotidyltransferase
MRADSRNASTLEGLKVVGVDGRSVSASTMDFTNGKIKPMKSVIFSVKTKIKPVGFPPVARTLPGAIERIVCELKPEKIILFGSYAYGKPTPDSDVDLLVIMKTRAKEIDRYVKVSNLLYPRQFPVDIIVKTPKEIEAESKKRGNFFMREVLRKGRVLYERLK